MLFPGLSGSLALLCLAVSVTAQTAGEPGLARADSVAGHVLIKFKPAAGADLDARPAPQALAHLLAQLHLPGGARLEEPVLSQLFRKKKAGALPVNLDRFLYLYLPPGMTVSHCIQHLVKHPLVEYVEPDGIGTGGLTVPSDPYFSSQWHHHNTSKPGADIHTPAAWDMTTGSSNVIVAVVDTGLDGSLSEFEGRLVPGFDFVNGDSDPSDDHGHGTAIAATLCANANNSNLGVGVDWQCRLMPLKGLDKNNIGLYSWWAQAVDFAVDNGCKVINLSAGGHTISTSLTRAISNAVAHDVLFVTITHNDGTNLIRFPGNLPEAITVGATDQWDQHADSSNFGPEIDLVAPGVSIGTVTVSNNWTRWSGTSFAAPQVAGVCALLASLRPGLSQEEARYFLTAGADDQVGSALDTPGFDIYYGYGRLNAFRSVCLAGTNLTQIAVLQSADPNPGTVGEAVSFFLTVTNRGPAEATGLLVTDLLPANTVLQSVQTSQGTYAYYPHAVMFQLGALPPQTSAALQLSVRADAAGLLTNRVTAFAQEDELYTADNESSQSVTVLWPDRDGDGMPDAWETAHGLNPDNPDDGALDNDGDQFTNREEYWAGTDPTDRQSYLRVDRIELEPDAVAIVFLAVSNRSYSVLYDDPLSAEPWQTLADIGESPTNRAMTVLDSAPVPPVRFYRIVTPQQPPALAPAPPGPLGESKSTR